jgi:hypothetical protein
MYRLFVSGLEPWYRLRTVLDLKLGHTCACESHVERVAGGLAPPPNYFVVPAV